MAGPGHSPAFLALVNEAKKKIRNVEAREVPGILKKDPKARLIDVREESEFAAGHVKGAEWIGKGILERDIEGKHPEKNEPLYLYCGGGFRSAIAAENLQKMGYTNVVNVEGGWRALKDLLPTEPGGHPFA